VTRRVFLRATGLVVAAIAVLVGLTIYFSTEATPPCLISGVQKWQPPTDSTLRRFEVVIPRHALCFFDIDDQQQLVGYIALPNIDRVVAAAPRDGRLALRYGNGRGALVDLKTGKLEYGVDPPPPLAGVLRSRAPDRPELWVLDRSADAIRVLNTNTSPPRQVARIKLTKTVHGGGALQHSNDGRFVYVGGVGDVIDAKLREEIANLEALRNSRVMLEVDWSDGKPLLTASAR
jgi:hypothetical protein